MSLDVTLSSGFSANITHNLGRMADAAGIYGVVWRPDENGVETAADIIPVLKRGLRRMLKDREKYEAYNAPNGWGCYKHFVPWLFDYLMACMENPEATVEVSR